MPVTKGQNAEPTEPRIHPRRLYRFIADEIEAESGINASGRRVWRLSSSQRLWSTFSKKRGLNRTAGPLVHTTSCNGSSPPDG